MSYSVLHIMKASGSCTAIARHIERCTQPDNAHPELRHLNRDDFIKYPDGVDGLGEAIQHRLDHAGLTRKIGKNQVLALNVLLSSDGNALRRLADEGRLDDWAESSVHWAKETFGEENVVGAHLHIGRADTAPPCHGRADSNHREKEEGERSESPEALSYQVGQHSQIECRQHYDP